MNRGIGIGLLRRLGQQLRWRKRIIGGLRSGLIKLGVVWVCQKDRKQDLSNRYFVLQDGRRFARLLHRQLIVCTIRQRHLGRRAPHPVQHCAGNGIQQIVGSATAPRIGE